MSKQKDILNKINNLIVTEEQDNLFIAYLEQYLKGLEDVVYRSKLHDLYLKSFLNDNTVYYNKTSKLFFNYWNNNYIICNEDNMIYSILDYISTNKSFIKNNSQNIETSIKYNIKNIILRYIKQKCSIYENIPETETIQSVMDGLVPSLFHNKPTAKLFLLVLGKILNKNIDDTQLFFMNPCIKTFLSEINKKMSIYFTNINIFNIIKFKFTSEHRHYSNIVIKSNSINFDFINFTEQFYINLICVSIYYANRYDDLSEYIQTELLMKEPNSDLFLLEEKNKNKIISDFKKKYLIDVEPSGHNSQSLNEKDLVFLWKKYKSETNILFSPFISYQDFLYDLFSYCGQTYDCNKKVNILDNYYSLVVPTIIFFMEFWNSFFEYDDNEYYFEINEILFLFNKHDKHKKHNFNDELLKYIIQVNCTDFVVINNKMIHNLKCSLWDKKKEIQSFLQKENINIDDKTNTQLYMIYSNNHQGGKMLKIGKKYFDTYLNQLREHTLT